MPKSSKLVLQQVKLSRHCHRVTCNDPLIENEISLPGNIYFILKAYCRLEGGKPKNWVVKIKQNTNQRLRVYGRREFFGSLSLNHQTFELTQDGSSFCFLFCRILKQCVLRPHLHLGHRKLCCPIRSISIWVSALWNTLCLPGLCVLVFYSIVL